MGSFLSLSYGGLMYPPKRLDLIRTLRIRTLFTGLGIRIVRTVRHVEYEFHRVHHRPQLRAGEETKFYMMDGVYIRLFLHQAALGVERGDECTKPST